MNSKVLFRNTLDIRNAGRPAFIPFVYSLAAKVIQTPLKDAVYDPTSFANSLETAWKLFNYDGITNVFDSTVEAEACGCTLKWGGDYDPPLIIKAPDLNEKLPEDLSGNERISVLLEATRRLSISAGKDVAIVGVITGLLSLAENLVEGLEGRLEKQGQDPKAQEILSLLGNLLTKYIKQLCETRIDAVFVREETTGASFLKEVKLVKEVYTTIFNIIRYYRSYPVLILSDFDLGDLPDLFDVLRPSGIVLRGLRFSKDDLNYLKELSNSRGICFGIALPFGEEKSLWEQLDIANDFVCRNRAPGLFYTSDGEIPYNIPMETIHGLMAKILNQQNCGGEK
ncbi:MAG: hypothetical protein A2Z02_06955 [Chloroflexi bacterium RBG_16_48_7]|nr:MAG: hypothetical protein A2Z02_06955 [Chloroflexi bacterium RBG_16_48_7]